MLWNEKSQTHPLQLRLAEQAARSLAITLRSFPVSAPEDVKPVLNKVFEEHVSALLVTGDALFFDRRADVIAFSLANRIVTFHTLPEEAVAGAVAAYGAELRTSINERPFTSAKFWQELHPPIYPWTKQRSSNLCST